MSAEKKELKVLVAKEIDDVMVLLRDLAKTIRSGGDVSALTGALITAISGIDKVDDEVREIPFAVASSAVNRALEIVEALLSSKAGDGEPVSDEEVLGEPV